MLADMVRTIAALLVLTVLGACGGGSTGPTRDADRIAVVTTLPVVAELVELVGGEAVDVHDLTPAGGEPHDLELSTDDIDRIEDADLVFYIGGDFQPAVERAVGRAKRAVDLLERLDAGPDPHFWLDPYLMVEAAPAIADELRAGAAHVVQDDLKTLAAEIEQGLQACERRLIVTSHRAFARFADRFGLEQEAIADHSAEEEPDAGRIAEVADLVRREGVTTVFGEPGAENDAAEAVAREAGVRTAILDPAERAGSSYFEVMRSNLETLRTGLGCR
jgi:zinc transport system substrate-binding protein